MIDQNKLDALFVKAKSAPHTSVFNETKEQFLIASSDMVDKMTSKKKFKPFNKGIIMLVIAGTIALTSFLMLSDTEEIKTETITQTKVELPTEFTEQTTQIEKKAVVKNLPKRKTDFLDEKEEVNVLFNPVSMKDANAFDFRARETKPSYSVVKPKDTVDSKQNNDFVFPQLTKEEISDNNKRKKKMLKALNKKDSKVYSYIPSGSFTFMSKTISLQSFHIQRTEVTNLEYKTFLFDLLIQDMKSEFLLAKPKQELWTEELGEDYRFMQDNYFSGEDYEECPVNNISRKGAELYCDWITREANEINKANGKNLINDVRIPMREEWVKAATVEGKFPEYAWDDSTSQIYYLCNFSLEGYVRPTLTAKRTGETFSVGHAGAITSGSSLHGLKRILSKSESFNENDYGLYNMCGNVAEMVYESSRSNDLVVKSTQMKSGTAGGGWMNTPDEVKLNAKDLYEGVEEEHLNIGFRVVITYLDSSN